MTDFGPRPERDKVDLSGKEQEGWDQISRDYGAWDDPLTNYRQNILYSDKLPAAVAAVVAVPPAAAAVVPSATSSWETAAAEFDTLLAERRRFARNAYGIGFAAGIALGSGITGIAVTLALR